MAAKPNRSRLSPGFLRAQYLLGLILNAKASPEALQHLEKSATEIPEARLLAAGILLRQGAKTSARAALRQYLSSGRAQNRSRVENWLAELR
jgi:hypothetical protein